MTKMVRIQIIHLVQLPWQTFSCMKSNEELPVNS